MLSKINLLSYYLKAAILPLAFIMGISILFLIAHFIFGLGGIYKSEWFTDSDMVMSCFIFYSLSALFMCMLCLSLFLNKLAVVRSNYLLSLLSWFLLPVGFLSIIVIHETQFYLTYHDKVDTEGELIWLFFTFSFIIGLIWTFSRFRKESLQFSARGPK
jgi:hypothetical protein